MQCKLFWFTESSCDDGTPVSAGALDPLLLERLQPLLNSPDEEVELLLPFLDQREWRHRSDILRAAAFTREGNTIRGRLPSPNADLRDRAALLIGTHSLWKSAPNEFDPRYFRTWQRVSLALQNALRRWLPENYFRDPARFEDRQEAYPMIVYQASRLCYGRPRTEFTYDVADPGALPAALKMIGHSLQVLLSGIEQRLYESGRAELARRYAPIWHQDILNDARKRWRKLVELLGKEAALINAVIDLGSSHKMTAVKPFAKAVNGALRSIYGMDLRALAPAVLDEASRTLSPGDEFHRVADVA